MGCGWQKVPLGATGMQVVPIGLGAAYGPAAADVERAIDRGLNYIYWGSVRRPSFAEALRRLGPARRQQLVLVVQTYTRIGRLMRRSLEKGLRELRTDYTDLLLLGWWNEPPPLGILEAALALKAEGKVRGILVSCHQRASFQQYLADPAYDAIMVRYNAAHPGAETEVFPHLTTRRAGVVAYTATRWGSLLDRRLTPAGERTPRASDCYRFALSHPAVDVCLAGPADAAELDEAMAALDRGPLDEEELAWMRRVGAHVHRMAAGKSRMVGLADRAVDLVSRLSHRWEH